MSKSLFYLLPLILFSCTEKVEQKKDAALTPQQQKTEAATRPPVARSFDNNVLRFSDKEGVIGVFEMGQMLALSITDSAAMMKVADKASRAYELLEKDVNTTGAEPDGPLGQISYNNNPDNFRFECILLIKKMPAVEPVHSKIVVLEASHMLVYNHYGPYHDLYKSYGKIRQICNEKGFVQSAPVREFYITDPSAVKEPSKWLTRILLPVRARTQ